MRGVVPVVSQVSSGVSEILKDTVNARMFPIGHPEIAATLVAELAHDVSQLTRLNKAAKQLGDQFRIDKMCASYAELLWATINPRQSFPLGLSRIAIMCTTITQLIKDGIYQTSSSRRMW